MKRSTACFLAFMACFVVCCFGQARESDPLWWKIFAPETSGSPLKSGGPTQIQSFSDLELEIVDSFTVDSYTASIFFDSSRGELGLLNFQGYVSILEVESFTEVCNFPVTPGSRAITNGMGSDYIFTMTNGVVSDTIPSRFWVEVWSKTGNLIRSIPIQGTNRLGQNIFWWTNGAMTAISDAHFNPNASGEQGTFYCLYSGEATERGVYYCVMYPDSIWAQYRFFPAYLPLPSGLFHNHDDSSWVVSDLFRGVYLYPDTAQGFTLPIEQESFDRGMIFGLDGSLRDLWVLAGIVDEEENITMTVYHFLRSPTSTDIRPVQPSNFRVHVDVYPNPVNEWFVLSLVGQLHGPPDVIIYNLVGQKVFKGTLNGRLMHINTAGWSSGIYFAQVGHNLLPTAKICVLK